MPLAINCRSVSLVNILLTVGFISPATARELSNSSRDIVNCTHSGGSAMARSSAGNSYRIHPFSKVEVITKPGMGVGVLVGLSVGVGFGVWVGFGVGVGVCVDVGTGVGVGVFVAVAVGVVVGVGVDARFCIAPQPTVNNKLKLNTNFGINCLLMFILFLLPFESSGNCIMNLSENSPLTHQKRSPA